jgi:hypothetical protein
MEYGAIDLHTKESEIRIVEADGSASRFISSLFAVANP